MTTKATHSADSRFDAVFGTSRGRPDVLSLAARDAAEGRLSALTSPGTMSAADITAACELFEQVDVTAAMEHPARVLARTVLSNDIYVNAAAMQVITDALVSEEIPAVPTRPSSLDTYSRAHDAHINDLIKCVTAGGPDLEDRLSAECAVRARETFAAITAARLHGQRQADRFTGWFDAPEPQRLQLLTVDLCVQAVRLAYVCGGAASKTALELRESLRPTMRALLDDQLDQAGLTRLELDTVLFGHAL